MTDRVQLQQLLIHGDFDVPEDHRVLSQLDQMRGRIATTLELPETTEPIHVYLFKTPRRYRKFLRAHFPDFPNRRAFFVQTDTKLSVYAQWGDRIAEDLRHEVAHGYIHAAVPTIPLWIDEGLAEYFEVADPRGFHRAHLDQLGVASERDGWRPRVLQLAQLQSIGDTEQLDYAESWAWVHFLLETTPQRRQLLTAYLQDLSRGQARMGLAERILQQEPRAEEALYEHLRSMAATAP